MLDKALVKNVLDTALSTGGDFAEIFVEHKDTNNMTMINGNVEKVLSGINYGVGIRIFDKFNSIYAYTNDTSKQNLLNTAKQAAVALNRAKKIDVLDFEIKTINNIHTVKILPTNVDKSKKVEIMKLANDTIINYDSLITQSEISCIEDVQNVLIANSNNLWVEDKRVHSRILIQAIASNNTEKQVGHMSPGASMGFEFFDTLDIKELAKEAARSAITILKADLCPSGKMPVIIDNAFGGVIFHEACGHSLEATSVAKNTSVFSNKLGQQIASPLVTAIDDGTIKNAWGSENIDDEGTSSQKNVLIENGILKSYLVDILNGRRMGAKVTGSSRRESYKYAPTSRMTNTYIQNGNSTPDEIIANTEYGLYAKQMAGGSVYPSTGEFNFAVNEAYIVRNGKIAEPVRGATLIGKGEQVLKDIDMVGNNLALASGICGSISGGVPVNVGQPMIRVSQITVGGRKEN